MVVLPGWRPRKCGEGELSQAFDDLHGKREGSSAFLPVEVLLDHARSCAVFFAPLALL